MPHKHDSRRNKFYTSGNFCSWSCMKSFALDKHGLTRGSIICGNIMTIEEFRLNQTVDVVKPNDIEMRPVVNNVIPFVSNTKKMDEIKNASSNNSALKLKRNKPLKRDYNNLESALGLIITPKT
jgi:hypothetical protein